MPSEFNYVTVYRVTRYYGGPEEGGWWYNWLDPTHSEDFTTDERVEELSNEWRPKGYGNIYSVLGGTEYRVYKEEVQHEFATKDRPRYE